MHVQGRLVFASGMVGVGGRRGDGGSTEGNTFILGFGAKGIHCIISTHKCMDKSISPMEEAMGDL